MPGLKEQPVDMVRRYERKLRVIGKEREFVDLMIRHHPAHLVEAYPPRYVNNLYLDTIRFTDYFNHMNGVPSRRKVRFRWYGDLLSDQLQPRLEIKGKVGWVTMKQTFDLPATPIQDLTNPNAWPGMIAGTKRPDQIAELIRPLQPALINRYRRDYYQTYDRTVRVTVDTEMSFYRPEPRVDSSLESHVDPAIVVEIKYDDRARDVAFSVMSHIPLPLNKNSKYITGLQKLYGVNF